MGSLEPSQNRIFVKPTSAQRSVPAVTDADKKRMAVDQLDAAPAAPTTADNGDNRAAAPAGLPSHKSGTDGAEARDTPRTTQPSGKSSGKSKSKGGYKPKSGPTWTYKEHRYFFEHLRYAADRSREEIAMGIANTLRTKAYDQVCAFYDNLTEKTLKIRAASDPHSPEKCTHKMLIHYWDTCWLPNWEVKIKKGKHSAKSKEENFEDKKRKEPSSACPDSAAKTDRSNKRRVAPALTDEGPAKPAAEAATPNLAAQVTPSIAAEAPLPATAPAQPKTAAAAMRGAITPDPVVAPGAAPATAGAAMLTADAAAAGPIIPVCFVPASERLSNFLMKANCPPRVKMDVLAGDSLSAVLSRLHSALTVSAPVLRRATPVVLAGTACNPVGRVPTWGGPALDPNFTVGEMIGHLRTTPTSPDNRMPILYQFESSAFICAAVPGAPVLAAAATVPLAPAAPTPPSAADLTRRRRTARKIKVADPLGMLLNAIQTCPKASVPSDRDSHVPWEEHGLGWVRSMPPAFVNHVAQVVGGTQPPFSAANMAAVVPLLAVQQQRPLAAAAARAQPSRAIAAPQPRRPGAPAAVFGAPAAAPEQDQHAHTEAVPTGGAKSLVQTLLEDSMDVGDIAFPRGPSGGGGTNAAEAAAELPAAGPAPMDTSEAGAPGNGGLGFTAGARGPKPAVLSGKRQRQSDEEGGPAAAGANMPRAEANAEPEAMPPPAQRPRKALGLKETLRLHALEQRKVKAAAKAAKLLKEAEDERKVAAAASRGGTAKGAAKGGAIAARATTNKAKSSRGMSAPIPIAFKGAGEPFSHPLNLSPLCTPPTVAAAQEQLQPAVELFPSAGAAAAVVPMVPVVVLPAGMPLPANMRQYLYAQPPPQGYAAAAPAPAAQGVQTAAAEAQDNSVELTGSLLAELLAPAPQPSQHAQQELREQPAAGQEAAAQGNAPDAEGVNFVTPPPKTRQGVGGGGVASFCPNSILRLSFSDEDWAPDGFAPDLAPQEGAADAAAAAGGEYGGGSLFGAASLLSFANGLPKAPDPTRPVVKEGLDALLGQAGDTIEAVEVAPAVAVAAEPVVDLAMLEGDGGNSWMDPFASNDGGAGRGQQPPAVALGDRPFAGQLPFSKPA